MWEYFDNMSLLRHSLHHRENEGVDQRKASAADSWDGVPPVSPKACLRDAVADELFDDAWQKVVGLLKELLHKHWEKQHSGGSVT